LHTPLPDPPPQGGREKKEGSINALGVILSPLEGES
jgi:hypothetical protein